MPEWVEEFEDLVPIYELNNISADWSVLAGIPYWENVPQELDFLDALQAHPGVVVDAVFWEGLCISGYMRYVMVKSEVRDALYVELREVCRRIVEGHAQELEFEQASASGLVAQASPRTIYVRRTRSADELGGDDDWEGLNVDESMARFDDLVAARVAEQFPEAKVELTEGTWMACGFEDERAVIDKLRDIQNEVYVDAHEWVVEA